MSSILSGLTSKTVAYSGAMLGGAARSIDSGNVDRLVTYNVVRPYKNVLVFESQRVALQTAIGAIYDIVPNLIRNSQRKIFDQRDEKIKSVNKQIEDEGKKVTENYGKLTTSDDKEIVALDVFGRPVPTALILSFKGEVDITYSMTFGRNDAVFERNYTLDTALPGRTQKRGAYEHRQKSEITSKDVVVIDLQPKIDCSSSRNVQVTPVQGRDYSRKEIIGNGDVKFSVSGKFVSKNPDVYPQSDVARFIEIMRHNGIIKVNNFIFGQHNVTNIIITDYQLPQTECLNEQPYSFTCVGVEPDEGKTHFDTLKAIEYQVVVGGLEGWYNSILMQKLIEQGQNATNMLFSGLTNLINNR